MRILTTVHGTLAVVDGIDSLGHVFERGLVPAPIARKLKQTFTRNRHLATHLGILAVSNAKKIRKGSVTGIMTSMSTDRSKELTVVTVVVLLMFLRVDGHAHPGMDTALKFGGLSFGH
jgi:hypothetical protein